MGITEVAPNRELSRYVRFKASMFEEVLRRTAISEEEFRSYRASTGMNECTVSWGDGNCSEVVLNEQFLKGLGNICLGLYRDLVNAGEKKLADRIVERSKEETRKSAEIERS